MRGVRQRTGRRAVRGGARALRDRRGATAAMVAAMMGILVAMAGLAAEGSQVFLLRRDAQNGADLAAMAAASAYQFRGRSGALTAANEVAVRNGLPGGGVTVNNPPASGAHAGNSGAFEVRVARDVPISLARAVTGVSSARIEVRAVSAVIGTTPACLLALTGGVTIQNSSSFDSTLCAVGSNAPGVSVNIPQSNSTVKARAVVAVGTCSGCNNARWTITEGTQEGAAPLSNPYERLDARSWPTVTGASCLNTSPMNVTGPIQPTGTSRAYCASVNVANTSAVTFPAGTYVFQNASLTVGSISSFACSGCTFIFRGSSPGNLSLSNTSSVTMSAPTTNSDDPDYDGVLIHRTRGGAVGNSGTPNLNMQSVSAFNLVGGIYAPDSYVRMGNVSSNTVTGCLALVGGTLDIGQLSSFRFDVTNCPGLRVPVPMARVARLVE